MPERRGQQVIRQWKILRMIAAADDGITTMEMHETFPEVHERTLRRDVRDLIQAGFPIKVRGRNPGRRFVLESPLDPEVALAKVDVIELVTLDLLMKILAPEGTGPVGEAAKEARARLRAVAQDKTRLFAEKLLDNFVAGDPKPPSPPDSTVTELVKRALVEETVLRILYAKPNKEPEWRDIEPHTLLFKDSSWYLAAYCRKAEGRRIFAVHRIVEAELLDDTYDLPPAAELRAYVEAGFGVFHDGAVHDVVVDFAPFHRHFALEREYHPTQEVEELEDGWVRVRMRVTGLPDVASWVARQGGGAVPIAPPALVHQVRKLYEAGIRAMDERLAELGELED